MNLGFVRYFFVFCSCFVHFCLLAGAQMQAVDVPHSLGASESGVVEPADALHDTSAKCSHEHAFQSNSVAASSATSDSDSTILALPAPNVMQAEGDSAMQLTLGQRVSLEEELGPLVVNADGTVARISNWKQMTERERSNVLRVLGKRNKERLDVLKEHATTQAQ